MNAASTSVTRNLLPRVAHDQIGERAAETDYCPAVCLGDCELKAPEDSGAVAGVATSALDAFSPGACDRAFFKGVGVALRSAARSSAASRASLRRLISSFCRFRASSILCVRLVVAFGIFTLHDTSTESSLFA